MDNQLRDLLNNSPSAVRNSLVIIVVRIIAWILGVVLFLFGLSLLISGLFSGVLMEMIMPENYIIENQDNQGVWNTVSLILGVFGLLIGSLLLFMTKISKMVLKRNAFILNILEWKHNFEKKEMEAYKEQNKINNL